LFEQRSKYLCLEVSDLDDSLAKVASFEHVDECFGCGLDALGDGFPVRELSLLEESGEGLESGRAVLLRVVRDDESLAADALPDEGVHAVDGLRILHPVVLRYHPAHRNTTKVVRIL
jgi:hypothetical protein